MSEILKGSLQENIDPPTLPDERLYLDVSYRDPFFEFLHESANTVRARVPCQGLSEIKVENELGGALKTLGTIMPPRERSSEDPFASKVP
jgi:hypothetical protein